MFPNLKAHLLFQPITKTMDQLEFNNSGYDLGWYIEILTARPLCLYYFGSFGTEQEAQQLQSGFVEDLRLENALIISINHRFFQPSEVTLTGDNLRSQIALFKKIVQSKIKPKLKLNQNAPSDIAV